MNTLEIISKGQWQLKAPRRSTPSLPPSLHPISSSFCCCYSSVTKLCLISVTPWTAVCQASLSFPISHSLLKLMSAESVMPSNHLTLCLPLLYLPSIFPSIRVFASSGQSIGASASASVLPMNSPGRFPLGLTGLISLQSKGLSRVFSNTTIWKPHFFSTQPYGPTLTCIHDYWKNHSFDQMDLCQQSDVSAF